jgi:hypothetical protein
MEDPEAEVNPNASDLVEVGLAANSFEAAIWARNLDAIGIESTLETRGGWLRTLLYLGRRPTAVMVASKDHLRAYAYLKENRFII